MTDVAKGLFAGSWILGEALWVRVREPSAQMIKAAQTEIKVMKWKEKIEQLNKDCLKKKKKENSFALSEYLPFLFKHSSSQTSLKQFSRG